MNFERNLDKYAELSIKVGMNVQPGETLTCSLTYRLR